jgi:hypothetical protein
LWHYRGFALRFLMLTVILLDSSCTGCLYNHTIREKPVEHLASRFGRWPCSSLGNPTTMPSSPALRSRIANLIVQKLWKYLSNNNNHAITTDSRDESSVRQHCVAKQNDSTNFVFSILDHLVLVPGW